jgi:hypothetical protein
MNTRFLTIAKNPVIIPGVHHHCDEWCDQCPVTNRCLAFRCTEDFRKQHKRRGGDPTFSSMEEAVRFTREIAEVEGTTTEELDELLSKPPGQSSITTDDPLAAAAWNYSISAAVFMMPLMDDVLGADSRPGRPEPADIVLWDHLRIYMRVFRALVARERPGSEKQDDAVGCARSAIVSIARSRTALGMLRAAENAAETDSLIAQLDTLERGLDERFPGARSYVRIGLDCPVA